MSKWKTLNLTECLDKSPKTTKIPKKKFLPSGKFPIISQEKGLVNGYWDDDSDVVKIDRPIVIFGDHTQVVKLVDFDFVVGADGVKLLKAKQFLDAKYLYYYLIGNPLKELGYARHYRLLKELNIRFPPIPEQKHIVAILDDAFAGIETAIANTEKNLANARELFESYLNAVFSQRSGDWVISPLGKCCQIKPPKKEARDSLSANAMVSFVPMNDLGIREKQLKPTEDRPLGSVVGSYTYFADGDVLLAKITPCFENGKLGVASGLTNGIGFGSSEFIVFRPNDSLDAEYLFYFLSRDSFRAAGAGVMSGAVGHKRVPKEYIQNCQIPLPPISEQKRIISMLDDMSDETHRLKLVYQQKLTALAELKQSLLQKAFSGELTAKAGNDVEEAVA